MKTYEKIVKSKEAPSTGVLWIREEEKIINGNTVTVETLWRFGSQGWNQVSTTDDIPSEFKELLNSLLGQPDGIAPLDENGLVPSNYLPSYVDDVLEFPTLKDFPKVGETGKIYVALDTNLTYRWSGSTYVEISKSIALGETSSTAYPGNKGKQNADNIAELQDAVFPITLTLSVSYTNDQHRATFTVKEKGVDFIGDTTTLTKTLGSGEVKTLTNTPAASGTFNSDIESNREIFKLEVTKTGRTSKSSSTTRYISYAGASTAEIISESVINTLTRYSSTNVAFNPTVNTNNNQYIWLVVPSYLTINRVTSAGFDVTLNAAQTITTSLGTFKAYRSANPLTAQSWNLVIS